MSNWLCNKCEVGVLNDVKQTLSKRSYMGMREAVCVCPECGEENPVWSLSDDPDCGVKLPEDTIVLIAGGLPNEWKLLVDVEPMAGHLVEYRGVNPAGRAREGYSDIGTIPREGYFVTDCGTHWTEDLNGFTTEKLGVIVAPDPNFTLWRHVIEPFMSENSGPIEPGVKAEMPSIVFGEPDTGIGIPKEHIHTFIEEGKEVGRFFFDEEIKRFKFEGDMEASAQIFMEHVLRTLNQRRD